VADGAWQCQLARAGLAPDGRPRRRYAGDGVTGVSARRDLGRSLAAERRAAGFTQRQLAVATGYSRSAVSNAEIGHPDVARVFWARCDQILGSGRGYELAFEKIRAAEREAAAGRGTGGPPAAPAASGTGRGRPPAGGDALAEALAGYQDLGWPAVAGYGTVELLTGEVIDALELPRAAGLLAASLWLYSRGRPDDARRLPALPHPARSLAVITAGDRCYVLAAAGGCPWPAPPQPDEAGPGPVRSDEAGPDADYPAGDPETDPPEAASPGRRVIRWHSGGSRILAPPSRLPGGGRAAWAHRPARPVHLPAPAAVLGLLATASADADDDGPPGLTLPGGVRVLPPSSPHPPG
jgi:Helix-turn-helix domain